MKILIAAGIFPPDIGGPATYSQTIAKSFSAMGQNKVSVVAYSDKFQDDSQAGFKIKRIIRSRFKPLHYYRYFKAVKALGADCDIIYAQDPVSAGYPAFLAARMLKKPFAVKVTGDYSWEQAMGRGRTKKLIDEFQVLPRYPFIIKKIRDIQFAVCREARLVVTPSQYLKKLVMGWGVAEKKIAVIYNAAAGIPPIDRTAARRELGLADSDFYAVTAGRPVPWKGFEVAERVFKDFQSVGPGIKYKILTHAPRLDVLRHIAAADVFLLNTGYEGFAHILIEAMALGTPIITTRVGGNLELVTEGETALLAGYNDYQDLKNALLKIYSDADLRNKLSKAGKKRLAEFEKNILSEDQMVLQTYETLQRCMS